MSQAEDFEIIETKTTEKDLLCEDTSFLMKKGDYTIHILIEEIKKIVTKSNRRPRPRVKITCLNQCKRLSDPDEDQDKEQYTFNEHVFFNESDLSVEILDSAKIVIEVYDYHNSKRENYIGIQEFDFEYIYKQNDHCIKNMWVALSNPESKDITSINGYLKLSISVSSHNDPKIELIPMPNNDGDCMLPPQIELKYNQVSVYIFKGESFPDINDNKNNKFNAFLECKYFNASRKTKLAMMEGKEFKWNQIIEIPIIIPLVSEKIKFQVKSNYSNKDYLLGSFEVDIDDIKDGLYNELRCVNIYGSMNTVGKTENDILMNENGEIGSRWKGRVYLKILYKNINSPISCVKDMDQKIIEETGNINRSNLWSFDVKLLWARFLPKKNTKYDIKLSIQDNSPEYFGFKEYTLDKISWNLHKSFALQTFSDEVDELPDLFIYLIDDKKEVISYQRLKLGKFLKGDAYVIKLLPELSNKKYTSVCYSGVIKIRMKLFNRTKNKNEVNDLSLFNEYDEEKTDLIGLDNALNGNMNLREIDDLEDLVKPEQNITNEIYLPGNDNKNDPNAAQNYNIVACVYMSRYLISGDSNGMSDPYCEITINGETRKTSVRKKCINGIWNEKLTFSTRFIYKDYFTWPLVLIKVMDQDSESNENKNEILGFTYLFMNEKIVLNSTKKQSPKWEQLFLDKSNLPHGQILISFYIFDSEHYNDANNIIIEPETEEYNFTINALGLRELKPLTFIDIKKPFISFDLNSIDVTKRSVPLDEIKTQPNESGPNPNVNSVISFTAQLPKELDFVPQLQCNVYDHVLGGLMTKLLGVFLIDIKQIIKGTTKAYKYEKEKVEEAEKLLQMKKEESLDSTTDKDKNSNSKEKDIESHDKPLIDEDINTKSNDKKRLFDDSKGNDLSELIDTEDKTKANENYICHKPSDLNKIYRGKYDNGKLRSKEIIHNSEYFVLKPSFTTMSLPKSSIKIQKEQNPQGENTDNRIEMRETTKHDIEDLANIPDRNLYIGIGFNKNDNKFHILDKNKEQLKLTLGEQIKNKDEEDTMELLPKENNIEITNNKKHYRRKYNIELEYVKELNLRPPFISCTLMRNKFIDTKMTAKSLFELMRNDEGKIIKKYEAKKKENVRLRGLKNADNLYMEYKEDLDELRINQGKTYDLRKFGEFKGLIRIAKHNEYLEHQNYKKDLLKKYNNKLPPELDFITAFEDINKYMLIKTPVIVRVYILQLLNLADRDTFSESDPYIKILLGDKILVNEKKKYFSDKKNCDWHQYYDLLIELPGSSKLIIQVMDHNPIFKDELIGETSIDVENRYFDPTWQSLVNKPVETRNLYHPDFEEPQGQVTMWLEMFDKNEEQLVDVWNIKPQPETTLQCRFIVYETDGMENMDIEDTSDIYISAYINAKEKQSTDIHYRCQNGVASFNWRLLLPIHTPEKSYNLTIDAYDNDILLRDDFICGCTLNLSYIVNDVNMIDLPIKLTKEYYKSLPQEKKVLSNIEFVGKDEDEEGAKFWVQLEKNGKKGGRVLCSLEIVPDWYAEAYPVGKGRESPNIEPYLPPPFGRISFTLNPIKMFNQLAGPRFRKKVCKFICYFLLAIYLVFLIPYGIYFLFGELINPFNYFGKSKKK